MKSFFSGLGIVLAALLVLAIIVFGGWKLGWWFTAQNTDLQNQVNHHSQQYQDALIEQERNELQGYDTASDDGQKKQIALTFCAQYQDITFPPADLAQRQPLICNN